VTTRAKIIVTVSATLAACGSGAYVSMDAAAGGHGSYMPMILLFPFSSIVMAGIAVWMRDVSGEIAEWVVPAIGIFQFASYGLLLARAWVRGYPKNCVVRLAIVHGLGVALFAGLLATDYFQR